MYNRNNSFRKHLIHCAAKSKVEKGIEMKLFLFFSALIIPRSVKW